MSGYTLTRTVPRPYAETVRLVRDALADQGFGVLTEIDLAATMREKLGADLPPQVILGACRPPLALAAVQAEPSIAAVLPCNVVVRAIDDATTLVEAFDPAAMTAMTANADLEPIADEAGRLLGAALTALGADPGDIAVAGRS